MSSSAAPPILSGSMNWEPVRQRLIGDDLEDAVKAATELRDNIDIVHSTEFPLLLSALMPSFSSILMQRTRPNPDTNSLEHKFRHLILDLISKFPNNEILRPHASHLVALATDTLNRDYEENALLASRIIFDLYKAYRTLPQDYVQPYLDFVISAYRALPAAVQRNFSYQSLTTYAGSPKNESPVKTPNSLGNEKTEKEADKTETSMQSGNASVASIGSSNNINPHISLHSKSSFRVLTECPLIVMLMFQLYPKFLKSNIPVLINVMMECLAVRAPPIASITSAEQKLDSNAKRLYLSRTRELVAAQAKTLSFLTYLLRTFSTELKPYEDRLATNVVTLMTTCPRESVATRKELLVATRHLLNNDFRSGFFRHIDVLLDERVLMGSNHRYSDQTLLRPLGYTTLSDLVQHTRSLMTMTQMSRVVGMFSRVLHDSSMTLPVTTQYSAVRTLLSVVDIIFHNKDPNPQLGRDMLVRILNTLVEKLNSLLDYFPKVLKCELQREKDGLDNSMALSGMDAPSLTGAPVDSVRDIQGMVRTIIIGQKNVIYSIQNYRNQRDKETMREFLVPAPGSNEEVSTAMHKMTNTEVEIVDRYIVSAISALNILKERGSLASQVAGQLTGEKSLVEYHRDAMTYFAAAFTVLDGYTLRRTLGRRIDMMIDAVVQDNALFIVVRHLLAANPTTSLEFCSMLTSRLVDRLEELGPPPSNGIVFINAYDESCTGLNESIEMKFHKRCERPPESDDILKHRSSMFLQLFERILKSLSAFPDNESVIRRYLRRIVVTCLRSSMENLDDWPDSYCMLLRYVFRSISAGKFEESYKELLPLIPPVLNGLYRVICFSDVSVVVRHTAIELCLTIPARLSSLLPHLNLLLRVIVPALNSNSGDLVNLGLRTLEFWVDNLNPLFLYPEISKERGVFTSLMQALSRHLRPAPYPYGLLTLRLLGKLGGKNRQFLREPLLICDDIHESRTECIDIECTWKHALPEENTGGVDSRTVGLNIPIEECVNVLKFVAIAQANVDGCKDAYFGANTSDFESFRDGDYLWTCKMETFDLKAYEKHVIEVTHFEQATAAFSVVRSCIGSIFGDSEADEEDIAVPSIGGQESSCGNYARQNTILGLFYASAIAPLKNEASEWLLSLSYKISKRILSAALVDILVLPIKKLNYSGYEFLNVILRQHNTAHFDGFLEILVVDLCEACCRLSYGQLDGVQEAICLLLETLGSKWGRKFEVPLIIAGMNPIKNVPRELSSYAVDALRFFIKLCMSLYGNPFDNDPIDDSFTRDFLSLDTYNIPRDDIDTKKKPDLILPCPEVIRIFLHEMVSTQHLVRYAARFALHRFLFYHEDSTLHEILSDQMAIVRRLLFSRSLRLLPLPHQVGVVDGLAFIIKRLPTLLPLTDQHVLAFLSEFLKIASVADGDMSDSTLQDSVVDRNGYCGPPSESKPMPSEYPTHASALFFRRACIVNLGPVHLLVPEELPPGVQLRVSGIQLLHFIISGHSDSFFDAENATPIGNIRPHVISLLFRSLVSTPPRAVFAAFRALNDVLSLCLNSKNESSDGDDKSQSRIPKELLQTCIRPVLLNLRDYTRLSLPLLRGLSRLLSLLSSWFNKTLGEKLLDHLQKWTDPSRIMSLNMWSEGEEPLVAAAIVSIFALLPHASGFVEPLVKTCIKLDATLPAFTKARYMESPYRLPLARYLNKYPEYTTSFFFQRLKTPIYSELFQALIRLEESGPLRAYLGNRQCSVMILNVCFEKPLAIIRSEKGESGRASKNSLSVHGIGPSQGTPLDGNVRPMNTEALELQYQGFRLVESLMLFDSKYFQNHNDIVRAFRWLWRSKGRHLRLQNEEFLPPRYTSESRMLTLFLMTYAKSLPNEDLDILFELIRVFVQPSTVDFNFLGDFLCHMVTEVLVEDQKIQILKRFFSLLTGESSEETKVLSIQFIVFPMLFGRVKLDSSARIDLAVDEKNVGMNGLVNQSTIDTFVKDVIFQHDGPIICGDRLKVELLRLMNFFVSHFAKLVEPHRKDMVRFCWGLLKSEDMLCKNWAYLVVCRLISVFDTPSKIVMQIYGALLRSYQQEGKELVRLGLDTLLPSLHRRLDDKEFRSAIDLTSQLLMEDANSVPQIAHVCLVIVRSPGIFYPYRSAFVEFMVTCLNRLGLPPNSPHENRILSIDVVELLLKWEEDVPEPSKLVTTDLADIVVNFVVRLKLLLGESSDSRNPKVESGAMSLDSRVAIILKRVLKSWGVSIRPQSFEKIVNKGKPAPVLLNCCLDVFSAQLDAGKHSFFEENCEIVKMIIGKSFEAARDDMRLRESIETVVTLGMKIPCFGHVICVSLEKIIVDGHVELSKSQNRSSDTSRQGANRARDRTSLIDESTSQVSHLYFGITLLSRIHDIKRECLLYLSDSILTFASTLTKNHLLEAASKQRQGSWNTSQGSSFKHPTPSKGIFEEGRTSGCGDATRSITSKARDKKETLTPEETVSCLLIILGMFEDSDLPYSFTQSRKLFFQIVNSLLDSSDNVKLLVVVTRIIAKLLLIDSCSGPLTRKERSSYLWKLSSFDFSGVQGEAEAQPLAEINSSFVRLLERGINRDSVDEESFPRRSIISCLMHYRLDVREEMLALFHGIRRIDGEEGIKDESIHVIEALWQFFHSDIEGLSGRYWIVTIVDILLRSLSVQRGEDSILSGLCALIHVDVGLCNKLFESLFPAAWSQIKSDAVRCRLALAIEFSLARPYHSQFVRDDTSKQHTNALRPFLAVILKLKPMPLVDPRVLVHIAEHYGAWFEALSILEKQYKSITDKDCRKRALSAMRHCYSRMKDDRSILSLARESCSIPGTVKALSLDLYGMVQKAVDEYTSLVESSLLDASEFEMGLWEERWVELNRDLCQMQVVSDFANSKDDQFLQLECAWKTRDWSKVRNLFSSPAIASLLETGNPLFKMNETLLAVAEGKLGEVENLHAQTAQLCLYDWQLLPNLSHDSLSHASLLHFFHRLVEIRESGQIMLETNTHANGRTLPDLKNLLSAWRHRLPNDWEPLSVWDELFSWRCVMFNTVTTTFSWADTDSLAALHDRPWAAIRMAKTARKQGMRDVALLLLNKTSDERAMNVSDAFLKLREQILMYDNPTSELERHGGLNMINTTNLSFFDLSQKSELFRLKALFLSSLGGRSKANQAHCHSVQICPTYARAWDSWGGLCFSLGAIAEKQIVDDKDDSNKEPSSHASKKVAQYLAQAMGCYLEAVQIDPNECNRIHLPKCLWMMTKEPPTSNLLCNTFENRAPHLPAWVWLPWLPQILTGFYRKEGRVIKAVFIKLVKCYPQAVYFPLRAYYLERRDVERSRSSSSSQMSSVLIAEEMMTILRRAHTALWTALESMLEELLVKFRPSQEEEFLATMLALLERAESQSSATALGPEETLVGSIWKTLGRIAVKYFRQSESSNRRDERGKRASEFKETYRHLFEEDFQVSSSDTIPPESKIPDMSLEDMLSKIRKWKFKVESQVLATPATVSLVASSHTLAMCSTGDAPDLWPGSCDPRHACPRTNDRDEDDKDGVSSLPSTSSSASAARKAAHHAAIAAAKVAYREGHGGDYGGGTSVVEVPGQYMPNSSDWADARPCPELHPKLMRFEPRIKVIYRNEQLVRSIGMIGNDGVTYKFLLQCALPYWTRCDERTAQTHYLLDKILRRHTLTSKHNLSAQFHAVIPVAQRLRLVRELSSRMSLDKICCDSQPRDTQEAFCRRFNDEVKRSLIDLKMDKLDEQEGRRAEKTARLRIFKSIANEAAIDPRMMAKYLQSTFYGSEPFYHFRRVFAKQWGMNCLLQHAFSVNERSPAHVVFNVTDGRVLSPDFRISYNSSGLIESHPVPFRLTSNLVEIIGFPGMDAHFTTTVASVATSAADLSDDIDPILRLLMRDDLNGFFTKSLAKSDNQNQEMEKHYSETVAKNVSRIQEIFKECAIKKIETADNTHDPIDKDVRDLIEKAQSVENICMMTGQYQGWI